MNDMAFYIGFWLIFFGFFLHLAESDSIGLWYVCAGCFIWSSAALFTVLSQTLEKIFS